jgi:ribosomal protein L28
VHFIHDVYSPIPDGLAVVDALSFTLSANVFFVSCLQHIVFGNTRAHSERKTRRTWKPNVHRKRLYSETFSKFLSINVTTHALKCIDKAGGLDNYLMYTNQAHLGGQLSLGGRLQQIVRHREKDAVEKRTNKFKSMVKVAMEAREAQNTEVIVAARADAKK